MSAIQPHCQSSTLKQFPLKLFRPSVKSLRWTVTYCFNFRLGVYKLMPVVMHADGHNDLIMTMKSTNIYLNICVE